MRRVRGAILLPVLLLAGCPTKAKFDSDGSAKGDGSVDATPRLQITSPADGSYTNGTVTITVVASGAMPPATISLLDESTSSTLATVPAPTSAQSPYSYSWNTTAVTDGPHTIVAQAKVGGDIVTSAPATINVDHKSPTAMLATPIAGAADVVLRAPITVTFSEAVAKASVTSSSLILTVGGSAVPTTVTLSADATVATIAINDLSSFGLPGTFSLMLTPTITDLAGNALTAPATAWSWTVPDFISYGSIPGLGNSVSNPLLAVTTTFRPVLGYSDLYVNSSGAVQYNLLHIQSSDGQSWTDFGRPSPSGNEDQGFSLALDANDHPVVAWSENSPAKMTNQIYVSTWDGSAWGAALTPVDALGGAATSPVLRLDGTGLPVVGWLNKSTQPDRNQDIYVTRWTGTQWNPAPGELGLTGIVSFDLILDSQGSAFVNWRDSGMTGVDVFRGTIESVGPSISATSSASVALDQASQPLIVEKGTGLEVYSLVGGAWQVAVPSSIPVGDAGESPKVRTGPDHKPIVGWLDSSTARIGFARWTGNAWDTRAGLFTGGGNVVFFDLFVDPRGTVWVAGSNPMRAFVLMSNY